MAASFAAAWFWFTKNAAVQRAAVIKAEHEALISRVTELELRERVAEEKITPIATAFQALLIKTLTHADREEMDSLLFKLGPPDTLNNEERTRLMIMLKERGAGSGAALTSDEREAAMILPAVMKIAAEEQANMDHAGSLRGLKLVTIISIADAGVDKAAPKVPSTGVASPPER
jgi:hypothetical protein